MTLRIYVCLGGCMHYLHTVPIELEKKMVLDPLELELSSGGLGTEPSPQQEQQMSRLPSPSTCVFSDCNNFVPHVQ